MERIIMDGDIEHGKIRKRGCSSSSSSSSSCAALVGKQRRSSNKILMEDDDHDVVVSSRKLGASFWEINDLVVDNPSPPLVSQVQIQQVSWSNLHDVRNGLLTSKQLVQVLHRLWHDQPQHHHSLTGSNIMSALRLELHRLRSQVDQMLQQFAQHKAVWRSKERDRIREAISVIASELEVEKKLRKQTERLNKKLGKELSDTKELLETEKKAKDVLEEMCDELVKGIAQDRAKLEEMKRESAKVIEQVEREREMLQVAHVLREERLQMTLSEAKYHFQEKNAAVDKLRIKLQGYLTNKLDHQDDNDDDDDDYDESGKIEELRMVLRKSGIEESKDSGGESDLHSIELNNVDSGRSSVEMMFKGRKSLSEKVQWGSICLNKEAAAAKFHS